MSGKIIGDISIPRKNYREFERKRKTYLKMKFLKHRIVWSAFLIISIAFVFQSISEAYNVNNILPAVAISFLAGMTFEKIILFFHGH